MTGAVAQLPNALLKNLHAFTFLFTSVLQLSYQDRVNFHSTKQNCFMKHVKKSFTLLMLLTFIFGSQAFAQDFGLDALLRPMRPEGTKPEPAKEVMQDFVLINRGCDKAGFFPSPLLLNGKPLAYKDFSVESKGELSVIKETIARETTQVPFYIYLKRNGNKVLIPGKESADVKQVKIDISKILMYAIPGDHLVIEPVREEDASLTTILKLLGRGC
jgi:hypothetical protein